MTVTLHGIPNCDTVKKARAWLDARGAAHVFRDFRKVPPDADEVRAWAAAVGWERLLNRGGTTFRKLPESETADLDEARAVALMVAHPSAIRRPVVAHGGGVLVGFDAGEWEAAGV